MKQLESKRRHFMTMAKPAHNWHEALPCGNGTMGAMIYGEICQETVMLNHEGLWYNGLDMELPNLSSNLPKLRQLLMEGKYSEADRFYPDLLREASYTGKNYVFQPGIDLNITANTNGAFTDYIRTLDFETGEATIIWKDTGVNYKRSLFVSRTDDVAALNISGSQKGKVSSNFTLGIHDLKDAFDSSGNLVNIPIEATVYTEGEYIYV